MNSGLLWLVPLLPLAASAINGLAGGRMGRRFTSVVAVGSVWLSFVLAVLVGIDAFSDVGPRAFDIQAPFYWFDSGQLRLTIGLLLDPLSMVMILIVTGVGALIHTYSIGYMADDPGYNRYFAYLNLFTFSMLILVLADSFLVMFVGWELVGLCSYLLIGFWYDRQSATDAGKKAFVVNRVGDWAFIIGVILIFIVFAGQVPDSAGMRFQSIFGYLARTVHGPEGLTGNLELIPLIALLLFIGATGKSAQLPILHIWLPDAMEGPTPVSALIHAATMVTAGVYMVARCHVFFLLSPAVMDLVAWIGVITAFVAATTAVVQTDIKRVLAYSTISQIGFMFIGAGVGAFAFSIFHLMTHAFFKALLFLGSGAVIHAIHNEQDMRKMGGLFKPLKPVAIQMLIGVATISGFPFLSAFFSKDAILGAAAEHQPLIWLLGSLTACITAFYMTRLWLMTFWGEEHWQETLRNAGHDHGHALAPQLDAPPVADGPGHGSPHAEAHTEHAAELHPTPQVMLVPMWVLAFLSIVGGAGMLFLPRFLSPVFSDLTLERPEGHAFAPEWVLMTIAAMIAALGIWWAYTWYFKSTAEPKPWMQRYPGLYNWFSNAWYIDRTMHQVFGEGGEQLAHKSYEQVEVLGIDQGGVHGVAEGVGWLAREFRWLQTGVVGDYALAMAFGVASVVVYFIMR